MTSRRRCGVWPSCAPTSGLRWVSAQLDLVPESDNGYIAGCAGLRCWMPEKGIWLQDDTISLLSPGFYRDLFLPQIRRIAAQFPAVAFHLHGDTRWAADLLLEVDEIDVLEMNYDVGVCDLEQVIADWRKIQQKKPVIAFANVSLQEFEHILDETVAGRTVRPDPLAHAGGRPGKTRPGAPPGINQGLRIDSGGGPARM